MDKLTLGVARLLNSKIFWLNFITTIIEIIVVLDGVLPAKYLAVTTTIKSILTIILRGWFFKPNDPPQIRITPEPPNEYEVL